ncbi:hypothetical protein CEY16_09165 [Halalkalibacillus sediminis]|uniref:Uncharacterized protein n=1 Tax=Halalkalibacillus sediminis TaxID=2018042 RepID=A0A2I0QUR9_9BACI|nr:hypothetical protein [Halalkalibacillus sediminis]PKR78076.1 hypothetical protein CEY16_09165 [Halalkalibacillus sediminis]
MKRFLLLLATCYSYTCKQIERDDLVILNENEIDVTYTELMEKGMQQTHGVGFEEYSKNLEKRLDIEKKRQQDHEKCNRLVAEVDRQLHR